MEGERQKIIDKEASVQVQQMFASSFYLSERFLTEFKEFWDLPEGWELKEEELGIPMFGAKHHMDLSELPDVHPVILTEQ
jgi:acetone carboxylase alpha subunit